MSQFGSGGGYMQDSSPSGYGSPGGGGKSKSQAQLSIRPLTIVQALRATQTHTDADWTLDDVELGSITIVAQAMSIKPQATNCVLTLEDGTNILEARNWSENDDQTPGQWRGIKDHDYVRVTGSLKVFGQNNKRFLNATHVRKCTDPYEPYYHILDAIYVSRIIEKGPPGGGGPVQQTGASSSAYTAGGRSTNGIGDQYADLPHLQKAIIKFMLEAEHSDDGIDVTEIVKGMEGSNHDANAISSALDVLMDAGHVFSTIDDNHFQVST